MNRFEPRTGQTDVLAYAAGEMGISAVPGSGKTRTLAELTAKLVDEMLEAGQEVLVVTLVNSAVDNLKRRIGDSLKQRLLLRGYGYRVRTLHGLAHDIVRERPGLVGLAEDFSIIDERESNGIRDAIADAWVQTHPEASDAYVGLDLGESRAQWVLRNKWHPLVRGIASAFAKRAKDLQLTPETLEKKLDSLSGSVHAEPDRHSLVLARLGTAIYADYQRSLAYRGAVDFDDLIGLAMQALESDSDYLSRLQARWPYILEDEAQDSSKLQERILRLLAGEVPNWVRVGDPNQAIYHTFTNANPQFLRDFLDEPAVTAVALPESGRSQLAIIGLANWLVDWTATEHPSERSEVKDTFVRQYIEITGPGDPQPNPPTDIDRVRLDEREYSPAAELQSVADSLAQWVPENSEATVAVLVPRNERGHKLTQVLEQRGIDYVDLLKSTVTTRETAGALGNILRCLADPLSARRLADAFRVWRRADRSNEEAAKNMEQAAQLLRRCPATEAYLWPRADHEWLDDEDGNPYPLALLGAFREVARRWHRASVLPIDQLILTLAGELFDEPQKLALSHKLAGLLRDAASSHPSYRLPELTEELETIAKNERRYFGLGGDDTGFEPPPGKVTVTTMHKAKGLEWDRVYLMSVNSYSFPSGLTEDEYIGEPWYIRDRLNLQAEALGQLAALGSWEEGSPESLSLPHEGEATQEARLEYVSERLRLLYVGITRAKRDLIVTWNTGQRSGSKQPAAPLAAMFQNWNRLRSALAPSYEEPVGE